MGKLLAVMREQNAVLPPFGPMILIGTAVKKMNPVWSLILALPIRYTASASARVQCGLQRISATEISWAR